MIELRSEYWAVEVPKNAKYHRIDGVPNGAFYELIFYKDSDDIDFSDEIQEVKIIDLPPGTWEIVCTSKEASPLQASEIVEHCWVENTNGVYQVTENPMETSGRPASLYFTSKFADEVGSEFIADFENPINAWLICKKLNDYKYLQAKVDMYEKALKEFTESNCDYENINHRSLHSPQCRRCKAAEVLEALSEGEGEKAK
jgi:hypothetical protein